MSFGQKRKILIKPLSTGRRNRNEEDNSVIKCISQTSNSILLRNKILFEKDCYIQKHK